MTSNPDPALALRSVVVPNHACLEAQGIAVVQVCLLVDLKQGFESPSMYIWRHDFCCGRLRTKHDWKLSHSVHNVLKGVDVDRFEFCGITGFPTPQCCGPLLGQVLELQWELVLLRCPVRNRRIPINGKSPPIAHCDLLLVCGKIELPQ